MTFNKLLLALTVMSASIAAQADTTSNFAGLSFGQTSDKINKSNALNNNLDHPNATGAIDGNNTYGVRLGQQNSQGRYYATYDNVSGSHNGIKLRQENLLGSYDLFYPVGGSTKLFGGATARSDQADSGVAEATAATVTSVMPSAASSVCCNKYRKTPRSNSVTVTCAATPAPR